MPIEISVNDQNMKKCSEQEWPEKYVVKNKEKIMHVLSKNKEFKNEKCTLKKCLSTIRNLLIGLLPTTNSTVAPT